MKSFIWPVSGQPDVLVAARFPFSPVMVERAYRHETYAVHQHHYTGEVTIGTRRFLLRAGDVTITPPDTVSSYRLAEAGYHWCVHFTPMVAAAGVPIFRLPFHLSLRGREPLIAEQMRVISGAHRARKGRTGNRALENIAVGTKVLNLLLSLALWEHKGTEGPARERRSDRALDAVRERLDLDFTKAVSVTEIVAASGLSHHYFTARFQERFGVSVNGYLLKLRLEMASHLLLFSNLPIKEIAYECGIADPNYFNKQFRRGYGMSPSEYRIRR